MSKFGSLVALMGLTFSQDLAAQEDSTPALPEGTLTVSCSSNYHLSAGVFERNGGICETEILKIFDNGAVLGGNFIYSNHSNEFAEFDTRAYFPFLNVNRFSAGIIYQNTQSFREGFEFGLNEAYLDLRHNFQGQGFGTRFLIGGAWGDFEGTLIENRSTYTLDNGLRFETWVTFENDVVRRNSAFTRGLFQISRDFPISLPSWLGGGNAILTPSAGYLGSLQSDYGEDNDYGYEGSTFRIGLVRAF